MPISISSQLSPAPALQPAKKNEAVKTEDIPKEEETKRTDTLEISEDALHVIRKTPETEEKTEDTADEEPKTDKAEEEVGSESSRTAVAVNVGKRARMIAAAETPAQVQIVLELLQGDLEDCQNGLKNGWCDENEVKKVEALIEMANQKMAEVAGNEENENAGIGAFELSMLF